MTTAPEVVSSVRAAVSAEMLAWMLGVEAKAAEQIDAGPGPRTDRGETKRSLQVEGPEPTQEGLRGVIRATSPHAVNVHEGRSPGSRRPPIAALVPWVERKLGVSGAEARSVAFLVARAIGRRGIRANPFLREPVREALPTLAPRLAEAAARGLAAAIPPQRAGSGSTV